MKKVVNPPRNSRQSHLLCDTSLLNRKYIVTNIYGCVTECGRRPWQPERVLDPCVVVKGFVRVSGEPPRVANDASVDVSPES